MTTSGSADGESPDAALPGVVARMWGREPVARKGPRPSLDLPTITAAAMAIADADGLAGVRMSAVATRLGVSAMSLYSYVANKDELLIAMTDAAVPEPPATDGVPWRAYLATWTRANLAFLLARPWLLEMARLVPPLGPRSLRWLDRAIAALDGTGLRHDQRVTIASTLTGYAWSHALFVHGLTRESGVLSGVDEYGRVLAALVDATAYPALHRAVAGGVFAGADEWTDDEDFRFGLDLLLDGVEVLVARAGSAG